MWTSEYCKFHVGCPKMQYWISNWPITFSKTVWFAKCNWSIHTVFQCCVLWKTNLTNLWYWVAGAGFHTALTDESESERMLRTEYIVTVRRVMYCKWSFHVIYLQLLIMYHNVVVLFTSCTCVLFVLTWLPGIRSILFDHRAGPIT